MRQRGASKDGKLQVWTMSPASPLHAATGATDYANNHIQCDAPRQHVRTVRRVLPQCRNGCFATGDSSARTGIWPTVRSAGSRHQINTRREPLGVPAQRTVNARHGQQ